MTTMEKRVMAAADDGARAGLLSGRQREILRRRAMGQNIKGIAEEMGLSAKTVEFHWQGVKMRTRLSDMADLTRFSIRVGLITAGLMMIVGCSDTPPIPRWHYHPDARPGAERLMRKSARVVEPSEQPPEWRFKSGMGHLVTLERNPSAPATNPVVVVSGYEAGQRPSTSNYSAYLYAGTNPPIFIAPNTPVAMIQILYSSSVDGPWHPLGDPVPSILPPPAYYKLSISLP